MQSLTAAPRQERISVYVVPRRTVVVGNTDYQSIWVQEFGLRILAQKGIEAYTNPRTMGRKGLSAVPLVDLGKSYSS
jgi:hypothetical protein